MMEGRKGSEMTELPLFWIIVAVLGLIALLIAIGVVGDVSGLVKGFLMT